MTEAIYRFARPEDEGDILDLINLVFSQTAQPHHFDALLPKVYAHGGYAPIHAVAQEEGRLRAAVGLLPLTLMTGGEKALTGGYIGSVSVHEKSRGRGHMKRLMQMQIEAAKKQGMAFLALGGQRQRYGYWGFEPCGAAYTFSVLAANVRHGIAVAPAVIREITSPDDPDLFAVKRLHESQEQYFLRPRLYDTLRSYNARLFTVRRQAEGQIVGYFTAMGDQITGLRLADPADVPGVIRAWMEGKKSCTVFVPAADRALAQALGDFAEGCQTGDAFLMKVLDWPRMLEAYLPLAAGAGLPRGGRVFEITGAGRWRVEFGPDACSVAPTDAPADDVLTERQAVTFFFSPRTALYQRDALLRCWLPLPIKIPVADQF